MKHQSTGVLIAASAALLALASTAIAQQASPRAIAADDKVSCYGINACKGQSECKTADNACKGLNQCKGHGFKTATAKACLAENGKILLPLPN